MPLFAGVAVLVHCRVFADLVDILLIVRHPGIMALSAACVALAELLRGSSDNLCGFTFTGDLQLFDDKVNEPLIVQATEVAVAFSFKFLVVHHSIAD